MISVTLKWPSALKFSGRIPATFEAFVSTYHHLSTFLRSDSGSSIVSFVMYSAGTFLAITLPAWIFLYFRKINKPFIRAADSAPLVNAPSPERRVGPIVDNAYSGGITRGLDVAYEDALTIDDADYAEELQFQETLIASFFTSELENIPSSSVQEPNVYKGVTKPEIAEDSYQSFCGICLENKESWLMFANETCHHSFCYECTTSHVVAKIQDKVRDIACPAPGCNAVLDFDACRLMISDEALVQWDESLCMSLIPESQKLYCPFRDCSALLVNDHGDAFEKLRCLVCSRWFCAQCRVPWHVDFTCKEFQKLYAKKGGKVDKIVKELAKKKSWQKCPKCKMYVEKTEGCVHITCRCKYEFCYRCGAKWSDSHGSCRRKS
ncbi:E3 ubiquitin-protein ligase RSL1-like isoform X1 [Salvia miltiorrhiza]|uniref:E3 ubiquitin-protein ligase RSL1-like isoform X1 n=1 Tax=Salvia miltiorrhiza TaxID=226208 RepID=UPI0025AC311D|nr:E3 ubiquitin-protein ligase RSL1-like isoform X1 [Salvia miltiorrhiza]